MPKFAVLNSSCDLVPGRAPHASLLRILPIRKDEEMAKEKLGTLLSGISGCEPSLFYCFSPKLLRRWQYEEAAGNFGICRSCKFRGGLRRVPPNPLSSRRGSACRCHIWLSFRRDQCDGIFCGLARFQNSVRFKLTHHRLCRKIAPVAILF